MATGIAAYLIVREVLVELALTGIALENAFERSLGVHGKGLSYECPIVELYHV
jgi:hypothetical protein